MESFVSLLQAFSELVAPALRFVVWAWPLKVAWMHDGERGVICTLGRVRAWRWPQAERGPGVTLYGPCEELFRVPALNCWVDTPAQTLMTSDGKVVIINAAYQYEVVNVRAAVLLTEKREETLSGILMDQTRQHANELTWKQLLDSENLTRDLCGRVNRRVSKHGLRLLTVMITDWEPHTTQMACDAVDRSVAAFTNGGTDG